MTTIKSYTDLEQSKKLAEILPLESADYHYISQEGRKPYFYEYTLPDSAIKTYNQDIKYIPCWSLAALLDILPKIHGGKPAIALDDNYITYPHMRGLHTKAENLVDACVAMIEKLHKLNLL